LPAGVAGDRAYLDKAEAECRQAVYAVAVLVQSGGQADGLGKSAHQSARIVRGAA